MTTTLVALLGSLLLALLLLSKSENCQCLCVKKNFFFYSIFLPLNSFHQNDTYLINFQPKIRNVKPNAQINIMSVAISNSKKQLIIQQLETPDINSIIKNIKYDTKYVERSKLDIYLNSTLNYFESHKGVACLAGFIGLYSIAGIYKSASNFTKLIYRNLNPNAVQSQKYLMGGFDKKMNKNEALQILNLTEGKLNQKVLKSTHRKIMLANHPDKGGSPYVATKINEAKDWLLKNVNVPKQ